MIFPTVPQVARKTKHTWTKYTIQYPVSHNEENFLEKFDPVNPPKVLDTERDFKEAIAYVMKSLWKDPEEIEGGFILYGKLEFVKRFTNPQTKAEEYLYTFTDPRSFIQSKHAPTQYIRTPAIHAPKSGIYVKMKVLAKNQTPNHPSFVEIADIEPNHNFLEQIQPPYLDYEKLQKTIAKEFIFEIESPLVSLSRNYSLTPQDMLHLSKVSGEGFASQNKGALSCNLVSSSKGTDSSYLEHLDVILSKLTFSIQSPTACSLDFVYSVDQKKFFNLLSVQNKDLEATRFPDYYGGNVGLAMNPIDVKDRREFVQKLDSPEQNICSDIINPIGKLTMATKTDFNRTLRHNPLMKFGSQFIYLMARLLPMSTPIRLIENNSPSELRATAVLNKYQEAIHQVGSKDIFPHLQLNETDVSRAKLFRRKTSKEAGDFIDSWF